MSTGAARRGAPLTREHILETALAIVDTEGLAALSMRRLSAQLGVEAMSLYHHVRDKRDLVEGINLLVLSRVDRSTDGMAWPQVLEAFAQRLYAAYRSHPDLVRALESDSPLSPEVLAGMDVVLAALGQTGLDPAEQVSAFRGLVAMSLGFVLVHTSGPPRPTVTGDHAWAGSDPRVLVDAGARNVLRLAEAFESTPWDDDVRFMLDAYLSALRARAAGPAAGA